MKEEFYTYMYYDPSRNNEPIYAGKGYNDRAWDHFSRIDRHPFTQRLQFMKKNGISPVIGLYAGLDEEFAHLLEIELISKFGRKDLGKGPLLNLTDGGEGVRGLVRSEESKQKSGSARKGKPRSEEIKKKISETKKGSTPWNKGLQTGPLSVEHKKHLSKIGTGRNHTSETIEQMSNIKMGDKNPMFGKKRSEETRLKGAKMNLGQKRSEESKQRMSAAITLWHQTRKVNNAIQRENNE
jgi:hypothetical protein